MKSSEHWDHLSASGNPGPGAQTRNEWPPGTPGYHTSPEVTLLLAGDMQRRKRVLQRVHSVSEKTPAITEEASALGLDVESTSRPFERIAIDITEMPSSASGNKKPW